jgi:hypothetical protein
VPFPLDDYSPFGLLANPWAEARSWTEGSGGTLRATEQRPGFGWLEPWATRPRRARALELGFEYRGRRYLTRKDFAEIGLSSSHHSANLFEYSWQHADLVYRVRLFSAAPDCLAARWIVRNESQQSQRVRALFGDCLWTCQETLDSDTAGRPLWCLTRRYYADKSVALKVVDNWEEGAPEPVAGQPGQAIRRIDSADVVVDPRQEMSWEITLTRGEVVDEQTLTASVTSRETELVAQDEAFWATCPQLSGDWPDDFRRGMVYDFETTRMCLQPPGGIFKDVWPAWMVNWPRAVLAEGTLDMLRLAYAQPDVAQRAVLSLFRDAPAPNVPCVFKHGEPNMVAEDGCACGTSPAWCVPFYNLRLLYLRTLDRVWLSELYPYLVAYVRWWLANRADQPGWTVYKCTWEAGEDNSPRLDPDREGDHVISRYARPVELQAAIADAAATLAFFGRELTQMTGNWTSGRPDDVVEWKSIERSALERLQRLWDGAEGRFRDWDVRRGCFIEPSGQKEYWGTDPRRFSPLALTPLLFGQTRAHQTSALRREIENYARPPWMEWPSWSYVVLEAASKARWYDLAGRLAYDVVRRVYAENDRRDLQETRWPMPGVAREYWPTDLNQWNASEGYGWGATTASFVIRQLCGFYESEQTSGCVFRLAPAFPDELIEGRELRLGPLPYRGRSLRLAYRLAAWDALEIELTVPEASSVRIYDEGTDELLLDGLPDAAHVFTLRRGRVARAELIG